MVDVQWIKLSTELFTNRKIRMIREDRYGDKYVLFWFYLLTLAGKLNYDGALMVTDTKPYTVKILAMESGFTEKTVENALNVFLEYGMIYIDNGVYVIKNWIKYQNAERLSDIREKTRLRVTKYRERQKKNPAEPEYESEDKDLLTEKECAELKRRLGENRFYHYYEAVKSCAARGKNYTKTSVFDAIIKMAEEDAKAALDKRRLSKTGVKTMTDDYIEDVFKRALERSFPNEKKTEST